MKHFNSFLRALSIGLTLTTVICAEVNSPKQSFSHTIVLYVTDSYGFTVPDSNFPVTLDITVDGSLVTINFPQITFQTTDQSYNPYGLPEVVVGGYAYTASNFLPKEILPIDLMNRSIVVPVSNPAPSQPASYIVQVTNAGAVVIQAAGIFGNIIPVGSQTVPPCTIIYKRKEQQELCENTQISSGFINITQFSGLAANFGFRDTHVNDAFDGVVTWAWTDNHNIPDKTNGTMNCFVAIGNVDKKGRLKICEPVQLTNYPPGVLAWDTAVAINRKNPDNIVVSWVEINTVLATAPLARAVSFDGGKTWPINGLVNHDAQPSGNPIWAGDFRGVGADKFGNIWFVATSLYSDSGAEINHPYFAMSTNGGKDFVKVQPNLIPVPPANTIFDFPQYCFGQDCSGNYGLIFQTTFVFDNFLEGYPTHGFIPITGCGKYEPGSWMPLPQFEDSLIEANLTASNDGRVWYSGTVVPGSNYIAPATLLYKSPGPLDQNYAGSWQQCFYNSLGFFWGISTQDSYPDFGYLLANMPQSIIYDNKRKALYAVLTQARPDYSQNMYLSFMISRDNGQTWSDPILVSNSVSGNRGIQSMALDIKTGNLLFGWYDGRNDPTFKSVQYFGAVIPAKKLDKLVNKIPLANPTYTVPPAPVQPRRTLTEQERKLRKKFFENRKSRFGKFINKDNALSDKKV